jgi:DNA-binding PadR family transcriptional regulator
VGDSTGPRQAEVPVADLYYRSAVLVLLTEREGYGDDLLDRLAELGFEARTASTLCQVLRDMEDEGLVSSDWQIDPGGGPPRQVRRLTAGGTASLRDLAPVMVRQRYALGVMLDRYRAQARRQCRSSTRSGHRA